MSDHIMTHQQYHKLLAQHQFLILPIPLLQFLNTSGYAHSVIEVMKTLISSATMKRHLQQDDAPLVTDISIRSISLYSNCSESSVKKALARLKKDKLIDRSIQKGQNREDLASLTHITLPDSIYHTLMDNQSTLRKTTTGQQLSLFDDKVSHHVNHLKLADPDTDQKTQAITDTEQTEQRTLALKTRTAALESSLFDTDDRIRELEKQKKSITALLGKDNRLDFSKHLPAISQINQQIKRLQLENYRCQTDIKLLNQQTFDHLSGNKTLSTKEKPTEKPATVTPLKFEKTPVAESDLHFLFEKVKILIATKKVHQGAHAAEVFSQIVFAITYGTFKASINKRKSINCCLKLMATNQWRRPFGYAQHQAQMSDIIKRFNVSIAKETPSRKVQGVYFYPPRV